MGILVATLGFPSHNAMGGFAHSYMPCYTITTKFINWPHRVMWRTPDEDKYEHPTQTRQVIGTQNPTRTWS